MHHARLKMIPRYNVLQVHYITYANVFHCISSVLREFPDAWNIRWRTEAIQCPNRGGKSFDFILFKVSDFYLGKSFPYYMYY